MSHCCIPVPLFAYSWLFFDYLQRGSFVLTVHLFGLFSGLFSLTSILFFTYFNDLLILEFSYSTFVLVLDCSR